MGQRTRKRALYHQGRWKQRDQRSYHSRRPEQTPEREKPDAAEAQRLNTLAMRAQRNAELNRLYHEFATQPGRLCRPDCGCAPSRKSTGYDATRGAVYPSS